jgi:hypothetical protein
MFLIVLATVVATLGVAAPARAGQLQRDRDKARELAIQVVALDGRIDAAVQDYAQATAGLQAVRAEMRDNQHLRLVAKLQFEIARSALMRRAVELYKHGDVTALDALLTAGDFQQLVDQLSQVQRVGQSDRAVLRAVVTSRRELEQRTGLLAADERTAERLVRARSAQLSRIRVELQRRKALLAGVKADIAGLAAQRVKAAPSPEASVEPPQPGGGGGGRGSWWPLIDSSAAAQGVDARGLYRLMMVESGGSAAVVSASGFCGLFQYAPGTWKGSWNPERGASIFDGAAQIRATALAIHLGKGPSWWGPSYSWAFGG